MLEGNAMTSGLIDKETGNPVKCYLIERTELISYCGAQEHLSRFLYAVTLGF